MSRNSKETLRKKMKKAGNARPSHVTKSRTEKYQCNGPSAWKAKLQALADKLAGRKGADLAIGIRAAMAKGLGEGAPDKGGVRAVDLVQTRIPGTGAR